MEKGRIETLATCAWLREHATVLIQGPPGVSKTHLAVALGVKAVECLVSYRYQRGSTLITTNKAVKDWPEILAGDEAMAAALLDRLLHRCHVLNSRAAPTGSETSKR